MSAEHILLICTGSVFGLMLFIYLLTVIEGHRVYKRMRTSILRSYRSSDLAKMEYDLAFYDADALDRVSKENEAQQVTIDDVLDPEKEICSLHETAIFARIGDEQDDVLVGRYTPDK